MIARWLLAARTLALVTMCDCATTMTPPNASLAQKLQSDVAALDKIAGDVALNCGAELGAFAKTVTTALAVAASYEDLLSDVANAAAEYAKVKMDIAAVKCVVNTVRADVKSLTPAKKAMLDRLVAALDSPVANAVLAMDTCKNDPGDYEGACYPIALDCGSDEECTP